MKRFVPECIVALVVLNLAYQVGCQKDTVYKPTPEVKLSEFYRDLYLNGLFKQTCKSLGISWGKRGTQTKPGTYSLEGLSTFDIQEFRGEFRCKPSEVDRLMWTLKEEVEKRARQASAIIHQPGAKVEHGTLEAFRFEYEVKKNRSKGEFTARVENTWSDQYPYQLVLTLQEGVRERKE